MHPPNINIEVIHSENFEESFTVPVILTGIPPPPILKCAEISFERLTNLVKTPPSPTGFDNVDETLSPFTSGFIPRSASDKSLKARSDTILSTFSWHSKYEHLYPRTLDIHTLTLPVEAKKNLYKTTHVDAFRTLLTTVKNRENFTEDDNRGNFNDSHPNTDILNSESEDSLILFPVNSDSEHEQENDLSRIQIDNSSTNDLFTEQSFDDECIVLRLPPPIPIITHKPISDPMIVHAMPNLSRSPSIHEYKPIARRRSNLKQSKYCPDSVIPVNAPGFGNSPETLRRPPSMFAEIDYSETEYFEKGTIKIPLSSVQRIPIPRSSPRLRCVQAPMPAHRPLSNRIGYLPLPPKATPRRPSSSTGPITILDQSSEYDKPSVDTYSSICCEIDDSTSTTNSASDSGLKLSYPAIDMFIDETNSISNFQTEDINQSLVIDNTTLLDQQSIVDIPEISDQCMLIEPEYNVILSEVEFETLAQLLEPPSPTKITDKSLFTSNEVESLSQSLSKETKIPITTQDANEHEIADLLVEFKPANSTLESDPDSIFTFTQSTLMTEERNNTDEELKTLSLGYANTKMDISRFDLMRKETKPIFSTEGPNNFQQIHPVMILNNPDPTLIKSITEESMQQFNILDPGTSQQLDLPPTMHERFINPTLPPSSPPMPIIVHPRIKTPNIMPRPRPPCFSRIIPGQLGKKSISQTPYNGILSVSQESKNALSEVETSNKISICRDSGIATSIESAHFTQHSTSPIRGIYTHEYSEKVKQPPKYVRAGNTEIRSARSIELFDRNPSYEPPQTPSLPPLHFPLPLNLSLVRAGIEDIPDREYLSSSDDSSAPPIPTTDPPELGVTYKIDANY